MDDGLGGFDGGVFYVADDRRRFLEILQRYQIPLDSHAATEIWTEYSASPADWELVERCASEHRRMWIEYQRGERRDWYTH